ncbi:MAG: FAD-linked oxidase C-terminal domain-containing protein, partial [Pseudomonadota bacterium]
SAAVCAFETVDAAVETVMATVQLGLPMARIELMDTQSIEAVNAYAGSQFPPCPHLLVEFHGSEASVAEQVDIFGDLARDYGGKGFDWARKTEDRNALWAMRHNAYHAITASRPGTKALVTDLCVPISRLAEAIAACRRDLDAAGIAGPILGHVGDGNFHAMLQFDETDEAERAKVVAVSEHLVDMALRLGGTATGEHGIGLGKLGYMTREHGPGWEMMGAIKAALDPDNIMNPGKLVPPRR